MAAEKNKAAGKTAAQLEADYTQAIEQRTADILRILDLSDGAKSNRVHDLVIDQYRFLRAWHDTNDLTLRNLGKESTPESEKRQEQIQASLKSQHTNFIRGLSNDLTSEQAEAVKDKMTYGTVKVTYEAYCQMVPTLGESEKVHILALLKDAREEAMDGGSSQEKAAIFKKYKGKINNYLSSRGHDIEKDRREWLAREKARAKSQ